MRPSARKNATVDTPRSLSWRERVSDLTVELALFLCSYAPLFVILAIRFRTTALIVACASLATIGAVGGITVLLRFRSVAASAWTVRAVEDRGGEVAGYPLWDGSKSGARVPYDSRKTSISPANAPPSQMRRLSIEAPVIEIATPSGRACIAQPYILTAGEQVEEAPWWDRAPNVIPVTTS